MRHIQGFSWDQVTLFSESLDEYITEDKPVRFLDAFVNAMDLKTSVVSEQCRRKPAGLLTFLPTSDFTSSCRKFADDSDGRLALVSGSELYRHLHILGQF